MEQGYFEEAREVLLALEADEPSDPRLPELYSRLERLVKEAETNPPVQQLERNEEQDFYVQPSFAAQREVAQSGSCCRIERVPERIVSAQAASESRTQRLITVATGVGIDVAQRAVSVVVKRLNRVISRIQERKGGL